MCSRRRQRTDDAPAVAATTSDDNKPSERLDANRRIVVRKAEAAPAHLAQRAPALSA